MPEKEVRGWILPAVMWVAGAFSHVNDVLTGPRVDDSNCDTQENKDANDDLRRRRAKRVDAVVFGEFLLPMIAFWIVSEFRTTHPGWCGAVTTIVVWRICTILAIALNVSLFFHMDVPANKGPNVASHERNVLLGFANYVQLILYFSVLYAWTPELLGKGENADWFDPIYLSAISQLTIGYGELHPEARLRGVACIQGLVAIVILVLQIGRFANLLRVIKAKDSPPSG